MKSMRNGAWHRQIVALFGVLALAMVTFGAAPAAAEPLTQTVYAVTANNTLVEFSANAPASVSAGRPITGLATGESIRAIDFRPADGQLYALSSASRLYTINLATGAVTAVGGAPISPAITGTALGFDFNPTVDRIRVVTNTGQNLRINPLNGTLAGTDTALSYIAADPNNGKTPGVAAAAYTNNISGTTSTSLLVIDATQDVLALQNPPNAGQLTTVGALGVDIGEVVGFDISPRGSAFVSYVVAGETSTSFGTIDLTTGQLRELGTLGGSDAVVAIALPTRSVVDETVYGVTNSNTLIEFRSNAPGKLIATRSISGLASGETIRGIDFRPATGQLYALSSASRLYTINPATGAATTVSTLPLSPTVTGSSSGFDFNPSVDRIRVVSTSGQNLRVNPINGTVAATDTPLSYLAGDLNTGKTPTVAAAAYTNNISGTTSTSLLVIDAAQNVLALQNPPNNGSLKTIGDLGVDVNEVLGFDISPTGANYVAYSTAGGDSTLGTIDLTTGTITPIRALATGVNLVGIAVPTRATASEALYGISGGNTLVELNSAAPGTSLSSRAITGLANGETIRGIDFRPATGQLFALSSANKLYTINPVSGVATAVGTAAFTPAISGSALGFDFNPSVDRIRVVTNTGQNLRLNPLNGTVAATDSPLAYKAGDPNAGKAPAAVAAAYTNNISGTTSTSLYVLDATQDVLALQSPPNDGALTTIGALGVNIGEVVSFDISPLGGAYVAYTAPGGSATILGQLDLETGKITPLGNLSTSISSIAIPIRQAIFRAWMPRIDR